MIDKSAAVVFIFQNKNAVAGTCLIKILSISIYKFCPQFPGGIPLKV